jgi:hypothetical protein
LLSVMTCELQKSNLHKCRGSWTGAAVHLARFTGMRGPSREFNVCNDPSSFSLAPEIGRRNQGLLGEAYDKDIKKVSTRFDESRVLRRNPSSCKAPLFILTGIFFSFILNRLRCFCAHYLTESYEPSLSTKFYTYTLRTPRFVSSISFSWLLLMYTAPMIWPQIHQ